MERKISIGQGPEVRAWFVHRSGVMMVLRVDCMSKARARFIGQFSVRFADDEFKKFAGARAGHWPEGWQEVDMWVGLQVEEGKG
jgi:hypothetical protein